MSVKSGPSEVLQTLKRKAIEGENPMVLLNLKADHLMNLSVQGSYKSVASALRCWHEFAVAMLGYDPESTLPPRCSRDVVLFVGIFRLGKTAQNYIGSIKWACTRLGLAVAWRDAEVALALAGAKKRTVAFVGEAANRSSY